MKVLDDTFTIYSKHKKINRLVLILIVFQLILVSQALAYNQPFPFDEDANIMKFTYQLLLEDARSKYMENADEGKERTAEAALARLKRKSFSRGSFRNPFKNKFNRKHNQRRRS